MKSETPSLREHAQQKMTAWNVLCIPMRARQSEPIDRFNLHTPIIWLELTDDD